MKAKNALSPDAPNAAKFREMFILSVGAYPETKVSYTNNIIERCTVINPPFNRTNLTTAIINSHAAPGAHSYSAVIRDCFVDGGDVGIWFHGITMYGTVGGIVEQNRIVNSRIGVYNDSGAFTKSVVVKNNTISNTCHGVYFNMGGSDNVFEKIAVLGDGRHPLFKQLSDLAPPAGGAPSWNFTKYLVDRKGNAVQRFDPRTSPEDPALVARIDALLAEKP